MELVTKETMSMAKSTGKEFSIGQMDQNTKATFSTTTSMATEHTCGQIKENTQEIG